MSRSIFGWDLPPGCSTSDLPGNRPEDQAFEAFCEQLSDLGLGDDNFDHVADGLWKIVGDAYAKGYAQGQADEALAQTFKGKE